MNNKPKILIVDDKPENIIALERVLSGLDVDFVRATSGNEAIKRTLEIDFAVALVDVQMSDMDGYETVELIRQEKKNERMPIIFLSAVYSDSYYQTKGIETGAVDFIVKPANPKILIGKLRILLDLYMHKKHLQDKHDTLELKVQERTAELVDLNKKLKKEICEHKQAESFITNILESIDDELFVVDKELKIISANRAFCKRVKMPIDHILGKYCYKISHNIDKPCWEVDESCMVKETFETGESYTTSHAHYNEKGNLISIELKTYPMKDKSGIFDSVIVICNDITEQKKLELQLRNSQKMETIGELAGGVAHDFNNILSAIISHAYVLLMKTKDKGKKHSIEQIINSTNRGTGLIKNLLTFSRNQETAPMLMNLNEIVMNVEKLLLKLIGKNFEAKFVLTKEDLKVMVDKGQIEQVLVNFVKNARDAMPQGGKLTIKTNKITIDNEYIKNHGCGRPGTYVVLSVADTGTGIDENIMERLYDPFFSTKKKGDGVGLGLSIVYGIIRQHNGFINVRSELNIGTTFEVFLPIISLDSKEAKDSIITSIEGGTETILFAEDDNGLRKVTKSLIEGYGYKVIEAVDGEDVLNKFIKNKENIQLVILDAIMPKKGSSEIYKKIRTMKPDIEILFLSGYEKKYICKNGKYDEDVEVILKPFLPVMLLRKIRELLDK